MPRRKYEPSKRAVTTRSQFSKNQNQPEPSPARNVNPKPVNQPRRRSRSVESRSSESSTSSSRRRSRSVDAILPETLRYQLTTNLLIPKLPFSRLIRECLQEYRYTDLRVTKECLECLQEASEIYMVQLFEDAYKCTIHRDRITLMPKDMDLALALRYHPV